MTLPRLTAVIAHWEAVPPLAVSVAALAHVMGVGKVSPKRPAPAAEKSDAEVANDMQRLMEELGAGGFGTGKPTWLTAAEAPK